MQKNTRNLLATLIASSALIAGAYAETQSLRQKAELKADHYTDAATVATLDKNTAVDVIRRDGGWVQVKSGNRQGWLRSEAFTAADSTAAPGAANDLLALSSGRSGGAGRNGLIATTGIRGIGKPKEAASEGYSKPPSAQVHALIMTIGAYQPPHQLEGVGKDADTAKDIAHRMGVTDANLRVLKDGDLTLDGIGKAFDDLEAKVQNNDQVFIYYSGHGGRQLVQEDGAERCAESLISVDGYGFIDSELEARLKRLSAKAQKVIVFIDACHSGGVTTRGVTANREFKAKSWNGKGMSDQSCAKPVNVLTRGINLAAKTAGSGGANFVYIAAARDNEISLDQPGRGGVASQAWLACMAGAAKDTDGSGGLSADEIRACAQERIDQKLANAAGYLPHHVTITGNPNVVLSYASKAAATSAPAPAPEPAAQPVALKPEAAPTPAPAAAPAPVAVAVKPRPMATLNDIYHNRDDRRLVTLTSARSKLRIGKDALDLTLTSREAGYVYLVMVGSDGETFDLLFPNQLDRNNQIQAGETLHLPRSTWQLTAQGPAGRDTLLAIVSDAPRDFSKAGLKPAGPFSSVEAVATKDIQLVSATSSEASSSECNSDANALRNLAIQKRCSNAYGAALLTIDEAQ